MSDAVEETDTSISPSLVALQEVLGEVPARARVGNTSAVDKMMFSVELHPRSLCVIVTE